ncbi:CCA tRNA nucleotidyltransferase [Akkermansia sp. N21116]|mgnify:FL=1|uniref:CCA tRNA nucleotidyltransferase n=1 Tax=Akkermansia sp. N21116 TaxID=3040764 RepID=UPI002AC99AB4|nr:CCA tRNA nucleotidyltransferase [Akkermansia sp. N21116]WPX39498.1 CCA tRNA nucleotidyltransferase [Akkermansia sp. N21116]
MRDLMDDCRLIESARKVAIRLRSAGYVCYFAGGCVRDRLLEVPLHDVDIATSAVPDEVLVLFPKGRAVGAHFGVVLVPCDDIYFDVATFRKDGDYKDGRRPESVHYSSPREDAFRRDFTVNGMFEDPETGEIIDYVGGLEDLEKKLIRCIGHAEERFREDSLRLMRAVRLAVTKGFDIESSTWDAIRDHADWLGRIAPERIRDEFDKILLSPHRRRGVEMLVESGLIKWIIPEIMELVGCDQPPQWHPEGDVYIHTMMMLDRLEDDGTEPSLELVLATLLHDIGKPASRFLDPEDDRIRFSGHEAVGRDMVSGILRRLHYPNSVVDAVSFMVGRHMQFINVDKMRRGKVRQFMASPVFDDEMKLHRADCLCSNGDLGHYRFLEERRREIENEPILPSPFVTGRDLIAMGMKCGPVFRTMLDGLFLEQIEGRLKTREEALEAARQYWKSGKFPGTEGEPPV